VTSHRTNSRLLVVLAVLMAVLALVALTLVESSRHQTSPGAALAATPTLDPGTPLHGTAPDFTLTDQFGARASLRSFRGHVVILAFNDSECTTVCPLTTSAMVEAKRMLGPAGGKVALVGIDANPDAISVADVRSYSELHGMTRTWRFLTGSLPQLKRVWHAYHIDVAIEGGQIDHTPALFAIDPAGRLAKVYLTQMSYASIDQQAQLLAQEASRLLPGHPRVDSSRSYAQIPTIPPTAHVALPRPGGGTVALGPGQGARLLAFFATWDREVTDLSGQLGALNRYATSAAARHLPPLVAVDEGSVEPSPAALPAFLARLRAPLGYPVAIDRSGRVADGYGVQDEPWLVLVSPTGRILWYHDVATEGWLPTAALIRNVRAALTHTGAAPGAAATKAVLAGSPPPLAALHSQAGRLLGGVPALQARLRALRGYPVVINAWASWCVPCRTEFGLFASTAARFGRRVAFLGVNTNDPSPGDARAFLASHPVSYPSYHGSSSDLSSLAVVQGLPTTIFVGANGKVVYVHTGQYDSQGALDGDVSTYATPSSP
jgi:cytochrome oxidase Cu insertion factor (SCO1/SenC/PrrC family)/thiol-disulfide isomerase/thioredoxin